MERTIPAFRSALPTLSRRVLPSVKQDKRGSWRVRDGAACCRGKPFKRLRSAATHLRSVAHLATEHGCPEWQLADLLSSAGHVWGPWEGSPWHGVEAAGMVREDGGVEELWACGIRPDTVAELRRAAAVVPDPLPLAFFVNATFGEVDMDWLLEVLSQRPDADTAAWLTGLRAPDRYADPGEWAAWFGFGLPKSAVRAAVEGGIPSNHVRLAAATTGWPVRTAARHLLQAHQSDVRLERRHLAALARHRIDDPRFPRAAIDSLQEALAPRVAHHDPRSELAVMLAILGNRYDVEAEVRAGAATLEDLDHHLTHLHELPG